MGVLLLMMLRHRLVYEHRARICPTRTCIRSGVIATKCACRLCAAASLRMAEHPIGVRTEGRCEASEAHGRFLLKGKAVRGIVLWACGQGVTWTWLRSWRLVWDMEGLGQCRRDDLRS